jgi:ribosome-associated toxin RatA of RatAB toxin-antitoxin module
MPSVHKSAIVAASCERMFALVDGVERYPGFLPWCSATEVLERTPEVTAARIEVDFNGIRTAFTTRNAKQPPRAMQLAFVEGPFKRFGGEWRFEPLGDAGCKVSLALDYAFSSRALQVLLGPAFGSIAATLVDSFVKQAEAMDEGQGG